MYFQCSCCPNEAEAQSLSSLKDKGWFVKALKVDDEPYLVCPDCILEPNQEQHFRSEVKRFRIQNNARKNRED